MALKKRDFIELFELPRAETVLVFGHVDTLAAKAYAFHFKPRALLEAGFVLEFDLAAGAHHALPGQGIARSAQQLGHLPVLPRVAGGGRYLGISGHFAFG